MTEAVVDTTVRTGDARVTELWIRTLDGVGDERSRLDLASAADPPPAVASATLSSRAPGGGLVVGDDPGWLAAGGAFEHPDGRIETVEVRWMVRARAGQLDVIGPGFGYRLHEFPDTTAWLQEDVSARLEAELAGLPAFAPVRRTEPFS